MEITFSRTDDARIIWLQGIGWAVAGGSLAGLCLVFTKAVVKIYYEPGHPVSTRMLDCSLADLLILTASTSYAFCHATLCDHHSHLPDCVPE